MKIIIKRSWLPWGLPHVTLDLTEGVTFFSIKGASKRIISATFTSKLINKGKIERGEYSCKLNQKDV